MLNYVGPFSYKNKSEIENLFLCGASTFSHGVAEATQSRIVATMWTLNCKPKDLLIEDSSQKIQI